MVRSLFVEFHSQSICSAVSLHSIGVSIKNSPPSHRHSITSDGEQRSTSLTTAFVLGQDNEGKAKQPRPFFLPRPFLPPSPSGSAPLAALEGEGRCSTAAWGYQGRAARRLTATVPAERNRKEGQAAREGRRKEGLGRKWSRGRPSGPRGLRTTSR